MPRKAQLNIDFIKRTGEGENDAASIFSTKVGDEVVTAPPPGQRLQFVAPQYLLDSPYQMRMVYPNIESLAEKIKSQGFQGSLPARKHPTLPGYFEVGFGHRRKRAAELAGVLIPIVEQEITNEQMLLLAISENNEREDLSALEEGYGFLRLNEEFSMSQEDIAAFVGEDRKVKIARGYVRNRLRAAQLARRYPDVKTLLEEKPEVSLRALGYLDDDLDERGRQFIVERLGQDDWSADTVGSAVKVLKAGGPDAEDLLSSQGKTLTNPAVKAEVATASTTREIPSEPSSPASMNGADGREASNETAQVLKRSGLLADALKRVRRYCTTFGEATPTPDERSMLEELVSLAQDLLEHS